MSGAEHGLNMLNFKNCKRCGKPFSTVLAYNICPKCMEEETEHFNRTREFIYATPGATEDDIIHACHISSDELTRWIREGRLELAAESPISYPCESCGALIRSGHFCLACKLKLQNKIPMDRIHELPKSDSAMRYFRNH